jgi:anti-sigma factor ChrR (cupin superfamily)
MSDETRNDRVEFDPALELALAHAAASAVYPRPEVKRRLMEALTAPPVPPGFVFRFAVDDDWLPHPVPGIRMKVLALDRAAGYAVLLLDAAPGTRFPPHHHGGAEECYVLSGTVDTCNRRMRAGDFLHADPDTDHGELFTEDGAQVLLIVPPDDDIPDPPSRRVSPATR